MYMSMYHEACDSDYNMYILFYRPKHATKVHVWAGISLKGPTGICIFEGKMDAELYAQVLESTLLPFLQHVPGSIRFQQDNAPSHTAAHTG